MNDCRSKIERALWKLVGPPLYYCENCLKSASMKNGEIVRTCVCISQIIAPRKTILIGKGGANLKTKTLIKWNQIKASITGRSC